MMEGVRIDAVLTDDESELVTIINGLEGQSESLEDRLGKVRRIGNLMTLGAGVTTATYFFDNNPTEKHGFLIASAGLLIGGLRALVKERKMIKSIRSKNRLANQLKMELEPSDLERYEERYELAYDDEDDGEGETHRF